MPDHCDLIVIGAGPAGSACAEAAAKSGLRVRVFDRARFPRTKPCAAGLTSRALELLGDLIDPVIHRRVCTVEMRLTQRVSGTWRSERTVVATTTRRELDPFLAGRAKTAGARVELGRSVFDISAGSDGVEVLSAGERLSAPYAVLADGAAGRLRARVGLRPLELGGAAYVRLYPGDGRTLGERAEGIVLDAGTRRRGYGWSFPKNDHINVGVCGLELPGPGYLRDVDRLVEKFGLSSWRSEGPFAGFVPRASRPDHHARGRVLAAGDAAGLADPVTGEGIAYAVQSGRIAASVIADALRAGAGCAGVDVAGVHRATTATPPDVSTRYRERIAAEILPHLTLLTPLTRRLQTVGPGLVGALLSVRPIAAAVERWVPQSPYTAGGILTIDVRR